MKKLKLKSLEDYEKATLPYREEYLIWNKRIQKKNNGKEKIKT